ncbi:MAG TPA: hypothetical protein VNK41_11170 [Vicinamibacterales bacterium]|nr:hypothetical protein [Vicinamibacterales bacterium]
MFLNGFRWPAGRDFAFTVVDDPDAQTLEQGREVYALLDDLGLRTTKAVWVMEPPTRNSGGDTCESREYLAFCQQLQAKGFEIAYHNGAPGTLERPTIIRSLDLFRQYFGHDPVTMANHYNEDAIYWGAARLSGLARTVYRAVSRGPRGFFGHVEGHPSFWGDVCRARVRYVRNFVYRTLNTLRACPVMPYADPERPYVQAWYASAEGANRASFVRRLSERELDRLESEHGACILYTHFGHGFVGNGRLDPEFKRLMTRVAARNGWFVPVATLLDHLASQRGVHVLTEGERRRLEWSWLSTKLVHGTS